MSTMKRVKELQVQFEAAKDAFVEASRLMFKDCVQELFDENPTLESFSWVQYTPYFNDGDTCEFGINADPDEINGTPGDDQSPWHFKYYAEKDKRSITSEEKAIGDRYESVRNFLNAFPEEVLKDMFGDHQRIIVTRNNIETEDYDHD